MPHLKCLNLCYNRIGNIGARAIARLLTDDSARPIHTIHTVKLARNKIYNAGGKALAWALTKNRHLTHLDLRMNRLGDPAGRDFAHGLVKNSSLLFLSLGANRLTDNAAYIFGKMLHHNKTLKEIDLSSNDIGRKGKRFRRFYSHIMFSLSYLVLPRDTLIRGRVYCSWNSLE
jgi:Ran GTPase-activating protein (RanGAP) involved in mRNA processing and transport